MYKILGKRVAQNPGIARPTRLVVDNPVRKIASKGIIVTVKVAKNGLKGQTKLYWSMSRGLVLEAANQILNKHRPGYILVLYYDLVTGREKLLEKGDKKLHQKWTTEKKEGKRK